MTKSRPSWSAVLPPLTAGLVLGGLSVTLSLSLASLIFSGPLGPFLPVAVRMVLFGAAVVSLVGVLTGSMPGIIMVPQSAPAALTALTAAALARPLAEQGLLPGPMGWAVTASLAIATVCTGAVLLLLGRLKLGAMVRFVPYPVFGGFLAGTGWLLVQGAMGAMTELPLTLSNLTVLASWQVGARWLPGLAFALILLAVLSRYPHPMVMPAAILAGVALFYTALWGLGLSTADAVSMGLMTPVMAPTRWLPSSQNDLFAVVTSWSQLSVVFQSLPALLTITVVDLLFSASALELAVAADIDLNRELRAAGMANLAAGLGGGIAGYQSMTFTVLSRQINPTNSRIPGLVAAALCGLTLVFGNALLHFFPKPILGGLLMFLGLSFLRQWLWDARMKLSAMDYGIVVLIFLAIVIRGFMAGLALGVVAAVALFVVDYSRINAVRNTLGGDLYHSNVDRSAREQRLLQEKGGGVTIFKLQGFIFFGTAATLLEAFRCRVKDRNRPVLRYAIFDFGRVTALDASAVYSFLRMRQLAEAEGIRLVLTQISGPIRQRLEKGGLREDRRGRVYFFEDLDRGLQWCEDRILDGCYDQEADADESLLDRLRRIFTDPDLAERFMGYLDKQTLDAGTLLIRQGEASDSLFFIESGQVTTLLETENGGNIRLRTMQAGTVVGEIGLYLDETRSASVIADRITTVFRLSDDALKQMRREAPDIAAEFHRFVACMLAERLVRTNATLKSLQD